MENKNTKYPPAVIESFGGVLFVEWVFFANRKSCRNFATKAADINHLLFNFEKKNVMVLIFGFRAAIFTLFLVVCARGAGFSSYGVRHAFEKTFDETCPKYPFVQAYLKQINSNPHPDDKYVIYSFAEHGMGSNGGLGDRLAGLVTAVAFAMRTGRRLLIVADSPFKSAFVPYHTSNRAQSNADKKDSDLPNARFHWQNWKWSGYDDSYANNTTFTHGCVNPKGRRSVACALDSEGRVPYENFKVVKHRGNRCYLCRWALKPELQGMQNELQKMLGVNRKTDLYEMAGCLLRLVMWPSEDLWARIDTYVEEQDPTLTARLSESSSGIFHMIGVHFRCGDSSFNVATGSVNPQCVADPLMVRKWEGTSFGDEYTMDSPLDIAACARRIAINAKTKGDTVLLYVASDYAASAIQINSTANWSLSLVPTGACHVDHTSGASAHACATGLYVQWVLLSFSDTLVVQSLKQKKDLQSAYYHEYTPETEKLEAAFEAIEPGGPVSAFSRYASMYGLRVDGLRYGHNCVLAERCSLSWQLRGNWMCDQKNFY